MEQQNNSKTFTVYTASAGSGKTFRLTLEYLKIALQNPSYKFKRILAITFTVKATNEMKARIVDACKTIAEMDITPLSVRNKAIFEQLVEETNFDERELQERASSLYKQLLHNYGDFAISTIDSFSQKIIRSFAYELQVPMQFETVIDTSPIKDYLVESTLQHVGGSDKDYTTLLIQFFRDKLLHEDSIRIEDDIESAVNEVLSESSLLARKKLGDIETKEFIQVQKQLSKDLILLEKKLKDIASQAMELFDTSTYGEIDLKGKSRSPFHTFRRLLDNPATKISDTFKANIITPQWLDKKIDDDNFQQKLSSFADEIATIQEQVIILGIFRKHFSKNALLSILSKFLSDYKKEEEIVLISEFNELISEQVKGQPAPFIYEKIGDRYTHLLLDEFQDTSVTQFHNLLPLITEMIEKESEPKSLIVGDSKQAIYRFRGGETEQLTRLPNLIGSEDDSILQEYEQSLNRHLGEESLAYNYRSYSEIVGFNNRLFKFITDQQEFHSYGDVYKEVEQKVQNKDTGGYISITRVDKKDTEEEKSVEIKRRMDVLLEHIKRLKSQGFKYRQIAIIGRKNDHLLESAMMLQANQIPFSSKESLKLNQENYITLFPAMIEIILTPDNQIIQAKIIDRLQEIGLIQKEKHQLHAEIGLHDIENLHDFNALIKRYVPTVDLLSFEGSDLLQSFEIYVSWLPVEYRQSLFISFFRDEIMQVIQQVGNNSEAFLDWWVTNNDKLKIKEGDDSKDAIQLYTIHASKGLEFDVVLMPFADWGINKGGSKWVDTDLLGKNISVANIPLTTKLEGTRYEDHLNEKNRNIILDHLNFLYVAVTRAVKELHFISLLPEKDKYNLEKLPDMGNVFNAFINDLSTTTWVQGSPVIETRDKTGFKESWMIEPFNEADLQGEMVVQHKSRVIWNPNIVEKIEYGELIHHLLSQIKSPEQIEQTIDSAISSGELPMYLKAELVEQFNTVIKQTELTDFFDTTKRIVSERAILLPDGKEYIPDRIVFSSDKNCKLLDFKTGQEKSQHQTQIGNYADILEQMGYTVTDKFIVYVNPLNVKAV